MSIYLDDDEDKNDVAPDINLDIDIDRLVASEPPASPVRRIDLRPILAGVVVLVLGGGLGTAAYFASSLDVIDLIGALDVSDQGPRLAMEMPGRAGDGPSPVTAPDQPAAAGGDTAAPDPIAALLAPPASAPSETPAAATDSPAPSPAESPSTPAPIVVEPARPSGIPEVPSVREVTPPPSFAGLPVFKDVKPLGPVPVEMLFRDTPAGPLPIIALDGRQPWREYAHPFDAPADKPLLAVVVGGLGLDRSATEAAISGLPPQVTLSFSPYANGLDKWVRLARQAGHEVMIGLPTESSGFPANDPGPLGLLTSLDAEENLIRLEKVLVRMPGFIGVLAQEGPFVSSGPHLKPILQDLKERGLMYVGAGASGDDAPAHAPVTERMDEDPFREAIDARLARAVAEARSNGRALVVASAPRPVTIERIVGFVSKLNGVTLAPASAVAIAPAGGKS